MTKEELEHDHIKEIAEKYINESWGSFADLSGVDLVMAGIGVAKIISKEKEKWIAELEKRCANYEMTISKMEKGTCDICKEIEKDKKIEELEAQIEKMKADVMANIKWADKNCDNMWQKLVKMWNQWEIKEK